MEGSPAAESDNGPTSRQQKQQQADNRQAAKDYELEAECTEYHATVATVPGWSGACALDDHGRQQLKQRQPQQYQQQRGRCTEMHDSNSPRQPAIDSAAAAAAGLVQPTAHAEKQATVNVETHQAETAAAAAVPEQAPAVAAATGALGYGVHLSNSTHEPIVADPLVRMTAAVGPQYMHNPAASAEVAVVYHNLIGDYYTQCAVPGCLDCAQGAVTIRYCNVPCCTQCPPPPPCHRYTAAAAPVAGAAAALVYPARPQVCCSALYGSYTSHHLTLEEVAQYGSEHYSGFDPPYSATVASNSATYGVQQLQQLPAYVLNGCVNRDVSPHSSSSSTAQLAPVSRPECFPPDTASATSTAAASSSPWDLHIVHAAMQQQQQHHISELVPRRSTFPMDWQSAAACGGGFASDAHLLPPALNSSMQLQFMCSRSISSVSAVTAPRQMSLPTVAMQYKYSAADVALGNTAAADSTSDAIPFSNHAAGRHPYQSQVPAAPTQLATATAAAADLVFPGVAPDVCSLLQCQTTSAADDGCIILYGHPEKAIDTTIPGSTVGADMPLPVSTNARRSQPAAAVAAAAGAGQAAGLQELFAADVATVTAAAAACDTTFGWLDPQQHLLDAVKVPERQLLRLPRLLDPEVVARCSSKAVSPRETAVAGLSTALGQGGLPADPLMFPEAPMPAAPAAFVTHSMPYTGVDQAAMQEPLPATARFTAEENAYLDSLAAAMAAIQQNAGAAAEMTAAAGSAVLQGSGLADGFTPDPAKPSDLTDPISLMGGLTGQVGPDKAALGLTGHAGGGLGSLADPTAVTAVEVAAVDMQPALPGDARDSGGILDDLWQWQSEEDVILEGLLAPMLPGPSLVQENSREELEELMNMMV